MDVFFHMIQCFQRKIKEFAIYDDYLKIKNVQKWFQLFSSLAFLPIRFIQTGFDWIKSIKPIELDQSKFESWIQYFEGMFVDVLNISTFSIF